MDGSDLRRRTRPRRGAIARAAAGVAMATMTMLAVLMLGGCPRPGTASIGGRVTQAPCGRPVIEGEPPCPDPPVIADIEVRRANGDLVARTRTDDDGRYLVRIPAAAGRFTVAVALGDPPPTWPQCPVVTVEVAHGEHETVDILCASGAR